MDGRLSCLRRFGAGGWEKTVILEIAAIVSDLLPDLLRGKGRLSVICIRTTEPKFLVFGQDRERPICVVQFGLKQKMESLNKIVSRIYAKDHDLVAQPLAFSPWRGDIHVLIQAGLPGRPRYRHKDHFTSQNDRLRVTSLATEALIRLHNAIKSFPDWTTRIRPSDQLRAQAEICLKNKSSVPLSEKARHGIRMLTDHLEELGELDSFGQHGDFCVDNLLMDRFSVAVIDFEEFGRTAMPLHDLMGLELSLIGMWKHKKLAPSPGEFHKSGCLNRGFTPGQLSGLYVHHLLFRINQCLARPTRAEIKSELLAMVEKAADGVADCGRPLPQSRWNRGRSTAAAIF
jgi:hypothetical protein